METRAALVESGCEARGWTESAALGLGRGGRVVVVAGVT